MSLATEQLEVLELARRELHVASGEPGDFVLLKRDDTTNALKVFMTICEGWYYAENDQLLNNSAMYELRISELVVDKTDLKDAVAGKHGEQVFSVVQPSPFRPAAGKRYWRFWLMPAEGAL